MAADIRSFGTLSDGRAVQSVRLRRGELTAVILTRGAVLQDLRLAGTPHSLTLGSDVLAAYEGPLAYFGAVVGPVANRIGGATAVIAGQRFDFPANEGAVLLHGGAQGTQAQLWEIVEAEDHRVQLRLALEDGAQGFPGHREITAEYALTADFELTLTLGATSDAPTLMALANHSYWNLDGTADYSGHRLRVAAERYLPVTDEGLPTGEARPVTGSFDLREGRHLDLSEGFDHCFCLARSPRALTPVAELIGAKGVRMVMETTEPGLQVYDGRGVQSGVYPGHAGQPYGPFAGLALEAERWPDAPNHPGFPSVTLLPGARYEQVTRWQFERVEAG